MERACPKLRTMSLHVTGRCNLRCRHCWVSPAPAECSQIGSAELSLAEIDAVMSEAVTLGLGSVTVTGGEPLLRPDILQVLRCLRSHGLSASLETNGTLVDDRIAEDLGGVRLAVVAVSLDGACGDTHDRFRGVIGAFEATVHAIELLKKRGVFVQVITCVWKGNCDELRSIFELACRLGVDELKITPISAFGRASNKMSTKQLRLSMPAQLELHQRVSSWVSESGPTRAFFSVPYAFRPLDSLAKSMHPCPLHTRLGVLHDGRVSICGIGEADGKLLFGNIRETSLAQLWHQSLGLAEIRRRIPSELEGVCGNCILKTYCLGFCRSAAYLESGSVTAPNSFCQEALERGLFPRSRLIDPNLAT